MSNHSAKHKRGGNRPPCFYITSLGCPKNTVDATAMSELLCRAGYQSTHDFHRADLVIVNTCGFIAPARAESLETLEVLGAEMRPDQHFVVAGCWAQRNPRELLEAVPRLDAVVGTRSWSSIVDVAHQLSLAQGATPVTALHNGSVVMPEAVDTIGYAAMGVTSFLKIADGCDRQCAFCAIPLIKGRYVSRDPDAIVKDARELQAQGVLEINLIAQDSTYYGQDQGMNDGLAGLLERLVTAVPDVPWIRVLYMYPGFFTPRLIDLMARYSQIVPYVDIPLQHAHPDVLRRMYRPADLGVVRRSVKQVRQAIPDVVVRTTFIVGYPGETDQEFQTLLDFVEDMRFDRMGAFTYSHELNTAAASLPDDVPEDVKEARYEALMLAQQPISHQKNLEWVGKSLPVLLEGAGDGLTIGRSYRDAPEIDGLVLLEGEYPVGRMATVNIVDATVYDLIGELV